MQELALRFDALQRARRLAAIWLVRIAWAPVLAWGVLTSDADDAFARTSIGVALAIAWLVAVRTFGPWTVNQGGRLEK